jgi:lysophospholipase L1-like esterase
MKLKAILAALHVILFAFLANAQSISPNPSTSPMPKIEEDGYDWYARHARIKASQKKMNPKVVMIGDSITHYWAGAKSIGSKDDFATKKEWLDCFGDIPSLNMGYGFDRTQNVIWRLENGELRNIKPELVIVLIGINNFATTKKFKANTPEETADGIRKILDLVNKFSPKSKILLLGTLPSFGPESSHRKNGEKLNKILSGFEKENNYKGKLTYLDFGKEFLDENGMIKAGLTRDKLHPTKKGYEIFAKNFKPFLKNIKIKKSHR